MPNWVYNTLSVSGSEEDVSAFRTEMSKPFTTYYSKFSMVDGKHIDIPDQQEHTPVFAFWNIIAPDPSDYEEYFATQPRKRSETPVNDPNWMADYLANQAVSKHWYDWNNEYWGTKWDVSGDARIVENNNPTNVTYQFDTAWSPVVELLVDGLSPRFPNLTFEYEYEEEQGWGGRLVFRDSFISDMDTWDIPSSHEDYDSRGLECPCETDGDFMYDDCPENTEKEKVK